MERARRGWVRLVLVLTLLSSVGTALVIGTTAGSAQATSCTGQTWPNTGSLQTYKSDSTNYYSMTYRFTLTDDQLASLRCTGPYLEIDFQIRNFDLPCQWDDYTVSGTNLPGALHDVAFADPCGEPNPAVTRIRTQNPGVPYPAGLQAGVPYYISMNWYGDPDPGWTPFAMIVWTPSRWADMSSPYESASCAGGSFGRNIYPEGDARNPNEAWCIFPVEPVEENAIILLGSKAFINGFPNGEIPLTGSYWYTFSPTTGSGGAPVPPPLPPPVNPTADRTVLHGSDGSLWVMAGGAKFYFGSMTEFYNLGYSTSGMTEASTSTLNTIPTVPRNGTVLRSGGGQLYIVAGGAKFPVGSMTEYYNQGYVNNQWTNVPQWSLDQIGDVPGNKPTDGTVIQSPSGALSVVVGGVKFQFGSMTEYHNLGYADAQITKVSAAADTLANASTATPTRDGTILRGGGGQVYVVAGGSKFQFGSMGEYNAQGYGSAPWRNVPQGPLDQISDAPGHVPGNGTVVQRPDGALFVIAGGVRWHFGSMTEFTNLGYNNYTRVSQAPLDGISDASTSNLPTDETVVQGTDSTIWVMKSGVRRSFTSMTQFAGMGYTTSQIVRVPDAVLNGLPSGGNLP